MKILSLYAHDDSSMGHQHERHLIGHFVGETEEECKEKVEKKYNQPFKQVIANWRGYEIHDAE